MVFKDFSWIKPRDICRIITSPSLEPKIIFSLKYRDKNGLILWDPRNDKFSCYVCMEDECNHVILCSQYAANHTYREPEPLTVKTSILNEMRIDDDIKHEIWLQAKQPGPLVQRVSPSTMVVKCVEPKAFPLGYLHISFATGRKVFACSCTGRQPNIRCFHFYSCIVVFTGDPKLAREFSYFLSLLQESRPPEKDPGTTILIIDPFKIDPKPSYILPERPVAPRLPKEKNNIAAQEIWPFEAWLSGVTEKINLNIRGEIKIPLVFHAPDNFFLLLKDRIVATQKKRISPAGSVLKKQCLWTWEFGDVSEARKVFNTRILDLEMKHTSKYLPLTIEWVPEVLPISKIGELKIKFP